MPQWVDINVEGSNQQQSNRPLQDDKLWMQPIWYRMYYLYEQSYVGR